MWECPRYAGELEEILPGMPARTGLSGYKRVESFKLRAPPDWMDTSDFEGGFHPLAGFPQVRLAVSRSGALETTRCGRGSFEPVAYVIPRGFHWASRGASSRPPPVRAHF